MKRIPGLLLLLAMSTSMAAPYLPRDDQQVLQTLPTRALPDAERSALQQATVSWRARPADVDAVDRLARLYIGQTRSSSDPRYLGYALALLEPWRSSTQVPVRIRLLRATLWQFNHQFQPALQELDFILRQPGAAAEAALMQASILMTQGEPEAARRSCTRLQGGSTLLLAMACNAQLDGLTGRGKTALQQMTRLLGLPGAGLDGPTREWLLLGRIELAQRLGQDGLVRTDLEQLLAAGSPSAAVRAAWTDYLLDQQRYREVLAFAGGDLRDDGLLLRVALAEQALRPPSAAARIKLLQDRFAAARLRGDRVHLREEARFTLDLLHQPATALTLAQANWQVQREPVDARLLLAAATAAGKPDAAAPVLQWLRATRLEDRELKHAVTRLGARS